LLLEFIEFFGEVFEMLKEKSVENMLLVLDVT